jgi:excisionase family DNA binding protein
MNLQIDPAAFTPLITQAVDAAVRRLQDERPRDEAGRILLTKREAAELLGVSEATLDRWRRHHNLPSVSPDRDRGRILFRPSSLEKWAAERERRTGGQEGGGE